jgi:hypothetical protein
MTHELMAQAVYMMAVAFTLTVLLAFPCECYNVSLPCLKAWMRLKARWITMRDMRREAKRKTYWEVDVREM